MTRGERSGAPKLAQKTFGETVYMTHDVRYCILTNPTKGTIMSDWYDRQQGATSNLAIHNGEAWTAEEIETVIAFTDDTTDADIALALGRTMAAVWNIQHRLRTEGVDLVRASYAPRPAPRTCDVHHIALTATGDCDWC